MPRVIDLPDTAACTLGECVAAIDAYGFAPCEEDSLLHAAGWLKRLSANREFLGDIMVDELKKARDGDVSQASAYGPQAIVLSSHHEAFFLRANIWPGADDAMLRAGGMGSFVYGLPHDHNFDFLTVGYCGPGYWSDYYEYDYGAVQGYVGETGGLRFVETSQLSPGKVMHYRAHRDVHRQRPGESLSVSLNVMHSNPAQGWLDQYAFDLENGAVAGIVNRGSSEALLQIGVALGHEECRDVAARFARSHPSDRMRLSAWTALAESEGDAPARDSTWARAERLGPPLVAQEAKERRRALANA
ncbi:transposase [Altererythrobacter sp. CAU 1778]